MQRSVENELLASIRRLQRRLDDQDALIIELKATIAAKDKRIEELERQLAKLKKNSSTSSKSPSSDIVKPSRDGRGRSKRKIGGQPGHKKHERKPFSPQEVDQVHVHTLDACPDCEGPVDLLDDAPRVVQQAELREKPLRLDGYRGLVYWCENCQKRNLTPQRRDGRGVIIVKAGMETTDGTDKQGLATEGALTRWVNVFSRIRRPNLLHPCHLCHPW